MAAELTSMLNSSSPRLNPNEYFASSVLDAAIVFTIDMVNSREDAWKMILGNPISWLALIDFEKFNKSVLAIRRDVVLSELKEGYSPENDLKRVAIKLGSAEKVDECFNGKCLSVFTEIKLETFFEFVVGSYFGILESCYKKALEDFSKSFGYLRPSLTVNYISFTNKTRFPGKAPLEIGEHFSNFQNLFKGKFNGKEVILKFIPGFTGDSPYISTPYYGHSDAMYQASYLTYRLGEWAIKYTGEFSVNGGFPMRLDTKWVSDKVMMYEYVEELSPSYYSPVPKYCEHLQFLLAMKTANEAHIISNFYTEEPIKYIYSKSEIVTIQVEGGTTAAPQVADCPATKITHLMDKIPEIPSYSRFLKNVKPEFMPCEFVIHNIRKYVDAHFTRFKDPVDVIKSVINHVIGRFNCSEKQKEDLDGIMIRTGGESGSKGGKLTVTRNNMGVITRHEH
jgi:hypothetical protein